MHECGSRRQRSLREVTFGPNWRAGTDITEHRAYEGKVYRAVVLDTFSRRSNHRGTYDVRPRGIGLATGGLGLVIDDGKSAALEVRQTFSHGLKLFGCVPYPVRDLADYFHGLPGAVGTGRISRKLFVRHIGVVLQFAFRFHDVDTTGAFAQRQLSPPHGGIQCLRHINVVRVASFAVVRLAPGNKQIAHRQVGPGAVEERTRLVHFKGFRHNKSRSL